MSEIALKDEFNGEVIPTLMAVDTEECLDANEDECVLEEDDSQCGYIFFNETSRLLKFFCTYCRRTFDNINYFCEHLSEHVNDDAGGDNIDDIMEQAESIKDEDYDKEVCGDTADTNLGKANLVNYNRRKIDIEELDEADEIAAEVEEEMRQLETDHILIEENSCTSDFSGYEDEATSQEQKENDVAFPPEAVNIRSEKKDEMDKAGERISSADFENLIDAASKVSATALPRKRTKKKKKVTTVKIIALKNRVAELYEAIKSEEEKRSKVSDSGVVPSTNSEENEQRQGETKELPVVQKIIGETVITLIPHGNPAGLSSANAQPSQTTNCGNSSGSANASDKTICPACGRQFRNAFSLTVHKRTHYLESKSSVKLAHKCSDCDRLFNTISDLKDHIQEVHYPEGFICRICNKKLSSLSMLESHMRRVHLSRPFACQICRKSFDNRDRFEEHVNAHVAGRTYKCYICGRKYSTECILKQHMNRHKERIPQCCVVCGKMTLRITQHMKIHAPRPKRILSCSICGKVFNFSSGLSQHLKVMHKQAAKKDGRHCDSQEYRKPELSQDLQLETQQPQAAAYDDNNQITKNEMIQKEEEAKRVIVELIQNATYTSFLPDDFSNVLEAGPPIAREETISAVNSIVNDA